jgi:group I intron endonuclease
MNDILTTTQSQPENKKEQIIWEEKNLTEPEKNYLPSSGSGDFDITTIIGKRYQLLEWRNTTSQKISGIYKIINKVNGKYYVGSSNNIIGDRWNNHVSLLNRNIHTNKKLQLDWNIYGKNNFLFTITELTPEEKLLPTEQKYLNICRNNPIEAYNNRYIATGFPSGQSHPNYIKIDDNTIKDANQIWIDGGVPALRKFLKSWGYGSRILQRILKVFKNNKDNLKLRRHNREIQRSETCPRVGFGENHPMFGKKHTSKSIEKMKIAQIGKIRSQESIEKMKKTKLSRTYPPRTYRKGKDHPSFGIPLCQDTKDKISKSLRGKKSGKLNPRFDNHIYTFKNIKTDEYFIGNRFEFYSKYNLDTSHICALINKKSKKCKDWVILDGSGNMSFKYSNYQFHNKITNEIYIGSYIGFRTTHHIHRKKVEQLINGKTKKIKEGWIFLGEVK